MNDSDLELLEHFISRGDQAAFAHLVARHRAMVEGVCHRVLAGGVEIDDAVQAAFVALATSGPLLARRWSGNDSLAGGLHRVATNAALELRRQDAARRRTELAFYELQSITRPQLQRQQSQWDELLPQLDDAIEGLPERFQGPLVLCYLEGRTQERAAVELGITFGTLRRRLQRAKSLLQARLTRRNATLTGMGLYTLLFSAAPAEAATSASRAATWALLDAVVKRLSTSSVAATDLSAQVTSMQALSTQAFSAKGIATMLGCAKTKAIAAGLLIGGLGLYSLHGLTSPTLAAGSGGGVANRSASAGGSSAQVARQKSSQDNGASNMLPSDAVPRRHPASRHSSNVAPLQSPAANSAVASATGSATASVTASTAPSAPHHTATLPSYESEQKPSKANVVFAPEINDNVITRFNDPADAPKVMQFMADKLQQAPDCRAELQKAIAGFPNAEQLKPLVDHLDFKHDAAIGNEKPTAEQGQPAANAKTVADELEELVDARATKAKPKASAVSKPTAAKRSPSNADREAMRVQKAGERQARRRSGGNSPSAAGQNPTKSVAGGFARGSVSGSGGGSFRPGGNGAAAFSGQINDNGNVTNFTDPAEAQRAMQQLKQKFPQLQQFNFGN